MNEIKHFILPENTNSLYKNEAISSIGLTREVADKINELVDAYNALNKLDLEWKQTQEGTIRKGVLFMKDNLVNSLNDLMETLNDSGFIDERLLHHAKSLSERLDNLIATTPDGNTENEIIDARIGAYGENYLSMGSAIRNQIDNVINLYKEVLSLITSKSSVNFLHINNVVTENVKNITVNFDIENQYIILNGATTEQNTFYLYCDASVIDNEKGDAYLMFENILDGQNAPTWGVTITYTDGTVDTMYSNSSIFHPVKNGKRINKMRIILGEGFIFNDTKLRLYGTYYVNNSHKVYEPFYQLSKEVQKPVSNLDGKLWVTLGDSITGNSGNSNGKEWQKEVAEYFNMSYVICSKGGRTTAGLLSDDLFNTIPNNADIISVMLGTNDFSQNVPLNVEGDEYYYSEGHFKGVLRKLVKELQEKLPNAIIIFSSTMGARLTNKGVAQDRPSINSLSLTTCDYAKVVREICDEYGVIYFNLHGESGVNYLNADEYLTDEVHPNEKGYNKITEVYIRNFKHFFE